MFCRNSNCRVELSKKTIRVSPNAYKLMDRAYYSDTIENFLSTSNDEVLGRLARKSEFSDEITQKGAWIEEIKILKKLLPGYDGKIYFEYSVPRMGKRIDILLIIKSVIFILEFKVGEKQFVSYAIDQVLDYALDMKNFHETSHDKIIAPVLVCTDAKINKKYFTLITHHDQIVEPLLSNSESLGLLIQEVTKYFNDQDAIDIKRWEQGRYQPTPTIVEAAMALYNNHSVKDISRSDASAINLNQTSDYLSKIIRDSRDKQDKAICFVTGVPGAGKTLVGLNIATTHFDKNSELYSVFLSGNGPLVAVLQEALARDKMKRASQNGGKIKKGEARSEVKAFIQIVHHFRDEGIKDNRPPVEHVVLFDEAQRAWTLEQTANFMKRKKGLPNFEMSEPEFLISCLNRHPDWAVVVCLVGGGQEINTGEAGISEWFNSLERSYPDWKIYVSNRLIDSEYNAEENLERIKYRSNVIYSDFLHLAVSMRSFRAENVSKLVKQILDIEMDGASKTYTELKEKYPIVITRDLIKAKKWLKDKARGSERYGIIVSSQAQRLKPYAVDVKSPIDPIFWFLNDKDDVRSSYYLEDVATEFHIQGLELDWACVTWDGDFKYNRHKDWEYRSFKGNKWQKINSPERKLYLKNAYRVLLTRARQGMVIFVPAGDQDDPTRLPELYDSTFHYLESIGFDRI